mmetsp:Transcript_8461/g.17502  ORF Transcript_8461/g.17502 Transcript_8461/m.17502 type:complete len:245 (-) Transcript_8461:2131-2865(-)
MESARSSRSPSSCTPSRYSSRSWSTSRRNASSHPRLTRCSALARIFSRLLICCVCLRVTTLAIAAGASPAAAPFFSSMVHTLQFRRHSTGRSMPDAASLSRSASASSAAMYASVASPNGSFAWCQNSHSKLTSCRVCGSVYPWSMGTSSYFPRACGSSGPRSRTRMLPPLRSVFAMRMSSTAILCTSSTWKAAVPISSQSPEQCTYCCREPFLGATVSSEPSRPPSMCAKVVGGTPEKLSWSRR